MSKGIATASLMLLTLLVGCTTGAFPTATTTKGETTTLTPSPTASTAPSTTTPSEEPSPARSITPSVTHPTSETPEVPPIYGPEFGNDVPEAPPPVTVRSGDAAFGVRAWTYCYDNGCVDGMPPSDPPDVGETRRIEIEFPLVGWTFNASFVPVGVECPRRHTVPVEKTGEHSFVLEPAGLADTYDVTLFGNGTGDLFVTFRWTTLHDGPMPVPEARLAVLADHDGAVDSYGVELSLSGLRATPRSASAEVTVTAANGRSLSFEAVRARRCFGEGTVYWDGPDRAGLRAADLGPGPFTYDVVVTLDGVRYRARAAWPADEINGNEPSVRLEFSPPLPAMP